MSSASVPFLAVGANRHPSAADWCSTGTFAFGAGRVVALWNPDDPTHRGVDATLKAHTDTVNAVRFLPGNDHVILSASVDKTVRVWKKDGERYALAATVEGVHKGSVHAIAVCKSRPDLFAAASSDGVVALYFLTPTGDVKHLHSLTTAPKFYPLTLALSTLPDASDAIIVAVAGSAKTISIYTAPSLSTPPTLSATLAGHENWIRALTFTAESSGDLLLASASQDKYIRLWRVHAGSTLPAATAQSESKTYGLATRLSNKAHMLHLPGDRTWSITFEALLMGHEDWIYTARWSPAGTALLTASADNSLTIWTPDEASGIWLATTRLGEISDLKGASTATGAAGGLWCGLWAPSGGAVAALSRTGAWRLWRYVEAEDRWRPAPGVSGHVRDATGVAWATEGGYLLSTSLDQTTRLWAEWKGAGGWAEISRPQIHGYDLNAVDVVSDGRFVSAAEEKLLRVFDLPRGVAASLKELAGVEVGAAGEDGTTERPAEAGLPVLGLSNKPLDAAPTGHAEDVEEDEPEPGPGPAEDAAPEPADEPAPTAPPTEDRLARHTLWPEHEKLYGHGYEVCALAASRAGGVIATACKASTADHAVIRLYSTTTWRELKPPLRAHELTVQALRFEAGGRRRLLSVGRDRAWAVFAETEEGGGWDVVQKMDKAHTRIVYDCAWLPREEEGAFVTVSRDRTLKLWRARGGKWECVCTVKGAAPLTAVDTAADGDRACWILVGSEDGGLALYRCHGDVVEEREVVERGITPDKAVSQIRWRPGRGGGGREAAVASEDGSVRILRFSSV